MHEQTKQCNVLNSKSTREEIRAEVVDIIYEGLLAGHLKSVVRPDGQIGYMLTEAGNAALSESRK